MEKAELKRILKLLLKTKRGEDITPEEGAEIDRFQEQHPESKEFIGALVRNEKGLKSIIQMSYELHQNGAMSLGSIKEHFDVMDPMSIIEELNDLGYEVALLNWRRHYAVAEFSFKEQMDENQKQFVYEIDDTNWHPTPKAALKAYLDSIDE